MSLVELQYWCEQSEGETIEQPHTVQSLKGIEICGCQKGFNS